MPSKGLEIMPKKPDCNECTAQIMRLRNKPFYAARSADDRVALADSLHRYGHTLADIVIDEALIRRYGDNGADGMPSDSDLWALCKADPADFESRRKPADTQKMASQTEINCESCNGTGYETVTALDRFGTVVSGARRCRSGCCVPAREVA